jgi:octaprenyl-diphosphate synthase
VDLNTASQAPEPPAAGRPEEYGLLVLERTLGEQGCPEQRDHLRALRGWLFEELSSLGDDFAGLRRADDFNPVNRQAAEFILGLPGKRLRPLCALVAARLGPEWRNPLVHDVAVAAEMVHNATLLHDDVIDLGTERRGQPCARVVYGNAASILGGDLLLVRAMQRIHRHGRPELVSGLLEVVERMVDAEAEQLELRGRLNLDRARYLRVIEGKTATLFRWSLAAGAAAANASPETVAAMQTVGACMGMSFQLVDDVLDLRGDAATLGKGLFADLEEGKTTWPLLVAAERSRTFAADLQRWMDSQRAGAVPSGEILAALEDLGAIDATMRLAEEHIQRALDALQVVPQGAARTVLEVILQAVIQRRS